MAITSAFLFVRSVAFPAGFLAAGVFFADFAFLLALRLTVVGAAASSRLIFSDSIVNVLIGPSVPTSMRQNLRP